MPGLPYYTAGYCDVTNNSANVVFGGGADIPNNVGIGWLYVGPDSKPHVVTAVGTNSCSIYPNYAGSTDTTHTVGNYFFMPASGMSAKAIADLNTLLTSSNYSDIAGLAPSSDGDGAEYLSGHWTVRTVLQRGLRIFQNLTEVNFAAASSTDLNNSSVTSPRVQATGSGVTIANFGTSGNGLWLLRWAGQNTISAGANVITPSGGDLTTYAGMMMWVEKVSGVARIFGITHAAATLTASAPILDQAQTWNNSGVTFRARKTNITDTASTAASLLDDLQVGGTSKYSVRKDGMVTSAGGFAIGADNAGALGASGTGFSALYLASGGVVNWNAGDVTATHSSNALAFAGAANGYSFDALLDISGASAGQLKFPVTQNASANAKTLDDYDEGTWTPSIAGDSVAGSQTYGTQGGRYTKIGRVVTVMWHITLTAFGGTTAGNITIAGLPFTSAAGSTIRPAGGTQWSNINLGSPTPVLACNIPPSDNHIYLSKCGNNIANALLQPADMGNTSSIIGSLTYSV